MRHLVIQLIPEQIRRGSIIRYHECFVGEEDLRENVLKSLVLEWGLGRLEVTCDELLWQYYLDE